MFLKTLTRAATLALVVAATACDDLGPTGPSHADDVALAGVSDLAFEDGRLALAWLEPLARDVSITQRFGVWGGFMELGTPGLKLWVPPFSLASDTEITISARSGADVAFDLGPHGTQFRAPVWVSIDLTKVLNGKALIEQLRGCASPDQPIGVVANGKKGKSPKPAGNKKKKKKKKEGSPNTDSDGTEASSPDTASDSATDASDELETCKFRWFEQLSGMDGVYMDPDSKDEVVRALEDFEVWIYMDRWLTFKTDHFSGYALAM